MGRVKQLDQVLKLINMIQLSLVRVRTSGRTRFCYCTSIQYSILSLSKLYSYVVRYKYRPVAGVRDFGTLLINK